MEPHEPTYAATVAHRLTTAVLILSSIFAVWIVVQAIAGERDDVFFDASATLDQELLPDGVYAIGEQDTGIAIENPTAREQRLGAASDLLPLVLTIAILWFLRGIARSVRDGDPFTATNVRRLQAIGGLLMVGFVAAHFADLALQDALLEPYSRARDAFDEPGLRPADDRFPGNALLFGLGVIVLAQVFAHGVALREDVDATI